MCIICVSKKGVRQPNTDELRTMFEANPHGAGYMVARRGRVEIHKGFMDFDDFLRNVRAERFTKNDAVVYHFRISTQAGVNPEMTHPFPMTDDGHALKALDVFCQMGIAHNGIIRLTSTGDKEYSDTALFVRDYMTRLIKNENDIHDGVMLSVIEKLIDSKMALMASDGEIETVGHFVDEGGLLFSNSTYKKITLGYVNRTYYKGKRYA